MHNAGPTIPPEQLPRLIEPMKRGEWSGAKAGTGLGLGLFIVKHLVMPTTAPWRCAPRRASAPPSRYACPGTLPPPSPAASMQEE